jgi:hypothetical protein
MKIRQLVNIQKPLLQENSLIQSGYNFTSDEELAKSIEGIIKLYIFKHCVDF